MKFYTVDLLTVLLLKHLKIYKTKKISNFNNKQREVLR